jgi:hypothetical protein
MMDYVYVAPFQGHKKGEVTTNPPAEAIQRNFVVPRNAALAAALGKVTTPQIVELHREAPNSGRLAKE